MYLSHICFSNCKFYFALCTIPHVLWESASTYISRFISCHTSLLPQYNITSLQHSATSFPALYRFIMDVRNVLFHPGELQPKLSSGFTSSSFRNSFPYVHRVSSFTALLFPWGSKHDIQNKDPLQLFLEPQDLLQSLVHNRYLIHVSWMRKLKKKISWA